jgi:tRNA-specific 2-thiouridylase
MAKVVVGMSGGIDSSVSAYLLKQEGFEVEGISFILWEARNRSNFTTCCSLEAVKSASKTAGTLGITLTSLDVREVFIEKVIEPFIDEYTRGLTPNPCILCNEYIKFPFLLREAEKRNAEFIATGHYARVEKIRDSGSEQCALKKGLDTQKDQSYVLYRVRKEELEKLVLPLGDYLKTNVRDIARSVDLEAADRQESQEICFIEDKNYFKFIEKISPVAGEPGPIIDKQGTVLGAHRGIYCYTIGQRKGLGIASPEPYYVTKIDQAKNAIYVGLKEDAEISKLFIENATWLFKPSSAVSKATVKVRSMMKDKPATIEILDKGVNVTFDEPQWAPAPGQSAVFYDGDIVIGGGIIAT